MKVIAALTIAVAGALLSGCGADSSTAGAPTAALVTSSVATMSSPSTTAPPVATATPELTTTATTSGANWRGKTCRDLLQMWGALGISGDAATAKALEDALAWFPTTPEWTTLSQADRDQSIQGARDAAAGTCK